ncbi:MAG: ribosome biogenesis factor YjgA [Aquabacterium sp.]
MTPPARPHRRRVADAPDDQAAADVRPSKSQRKRDMTDLQVLGAQLADLSPDRLAAIDMPDALRDAIEALHRTRSHEGRRRQLQFIGKQMRAADPQPLREAVAAARLGSARDALLLHQAEAWRAQLLSSDDAVTRWASRHPDSDLQQLRSLVRAARQDIAAPEQRHGRAWRDLFRYIKPWLTDETP